MVSATSQTTAHSLPTLATTTATVMGTVMSATICPGCPNPDQSDKNGDGVGDVCDGGRKLREQVPLRGR